MNKKIKNEQLAQQQSSVQQLLASIEQQELANPEHYERLESVIIRLHDCKIEDMFAKLQTPEHLTEEERNEMLDTYMYTELKSKDEHTTISVASADDDGNLLTHSGCFRATGIYFTESKSWDILEEEYYV